MKEEIYLCDRCGADPPELFLVDDSDRSVGYVDSLRLCWDCFVGKGAYRRRIDNEEAEGQFRFYNDWFERHSDCSRVLSPGTLMAGRRRRRDNEN